MAVTADIRTGSRSLTSYLLSPVDEIRRTVAREH
jgi:hemolysin D